MKKLFAILSAVLVLASCSNEIDSQVAMTSDEGAIRLGVATRADIADESVAIKIYKVENGEESLIRRYTSFNDVPEYLALLAGDYVAKVQVGERRVATFDSKFYYGEQPFSVEKGIVTSVTVDCMLGSSIVKVEYDASVAEKLSTTTAYVSYTVNVVEPSSLSSSAA